MNDFDIIWVSLAIGRYRCGRVAGRNTHSHMRWIDCDGFARGRRGEGSHSRTRRFFQFDMSRRKKRVRDKGRVF